MVILSGTWFKIEIRICFQLTWGTDLQVVATVICFLNVTVIEHTFTANGWSHGANFHIGLKGDPFSF